MPPTLVARPCAPREAWGLSPAEKEVDAPPAVGIAKAPEEARCLKEPTAPFGLRSLRGMQHKLTQDIERHKGQCQMLKRQCDLVDHNKNSLRQTLRAKFVQNVPLLSDFVFTAEERATLVNKLRPWNHAAGTTLCEEGAVGDRLFILENGNCTVYRFVKDERGEMGQVRVKRLVSGDFFGELAVMYNVPRAATVITESRTTVLTLSRDDLFSVVKTKEQHHRLQVVARAGFLQDIPLFSAMKLAEKVTIAKVLHLSRYEAGQIIVRQGEHLSGDTQRIFIIEDGLCTAELQLDEGKDTVTLEQLRPGQSFGMLGMMYGAPRGATVRAKSRCSTISMSRDELVAAVSRETMAQIRRAAQHDLLRRVPLLQAANAEGWQHLFDDMEVVKYKKWEIIIDRGAPLDRLFLLEEGMLVETVEVEKTYAERNISVEQFTDVQIKEFKEAFDYYDLDHGGSISVGELIECMKSAGQHVTKEEVLKMISVVDTGADGEIEFPEFLELMAHRMRTDPRILVNEHRTPGTWFCDSCIQEPMPLSHTMLVAASDVSMLVLPRETVIHCLQSNPGKELLAEAAAMRFSKKLRSSLHTPVAAKRHSTIAGCDF